MQSVYIAEILCLSSFFDIPFFKMIVPKIKFLFDGLGILVLIFGISASGRQIYLQNIPKDQLVAGYCDTPFYLLFDMYPFFDAMSKVFQGSSKCAEESWSLLGLNIAEWSLVFLLSNDNFNTGRYLLIILKGHRYN